MTEDIDSQPLSLEQSAVLDEKGIFLLWGDIVSKVSFDFVDFVLRHNIKPKLKNLSVIINSQGGKVSETAAIVDIMKLSKIPIHTYGVGSVCSAGVDILMTGAKGHRYIFETTTIMTHQWSGLVEAGGKGKKTSADRYHKIADEISKKIILNAGIPEESIEEILTEYDKYMMADEAISLGLADHIVKKLPF